MMTLQRQQTQKGFTMVELIITVGILAVLAAFAMPTMVKTKRKTDLNREVSAVVEALQQARSEAVIKKVEKSAVTPTLKFTQTTPNTLDVRYDYMGRVQFDVSNKARCVNVVVEHKDDPNIVASIEIREVGSPEVVKLRQGQCR